MPVVAAEAARKLDGGRLAVVVVADFDGPAGGRIDAPGPGYRNVVLGRDQFPGGPIDDVEEAVLRSLHDHLARLAADVQVREGKRLGGIEVPAVARGGLI